MLKKVIFIAIPICLLLLGFMIQPESVRAEVGTATPALSPTVSPSPTPIPCAKGDGYLEAGILEKAQEAYIEELGTTPGLECAIQALNALPKPSEKIRKTIEFGDYDTAWNDLQSALKVAPEDDKLLKIANEPWTFWYKAKSFISSFIVTSSIAILILVWAIIKIATGKPKLDIDEFDASIIGDGAKAKSLATEIQARFEQAVGDQGQLRDIKHPDLINAPLDELTAPDIGLPDSLNKYFTFIFKLIQPKVVIVKGILTKDKEKGYGIIIRLFQKGNSKMWGVDSVWELDVIPGFELDNLEMPNDDDRYRALAKYTAVLAHWIYYQQEDPDGLEHAFGTKIYRSHILTRIATELQEKESKNKLVETMLRRALAEDGKNIVAMLNLGKFLAHIKSDESEKILLEVKESTKTHEELATLPHIHACYRLGANIIEKIKPNSVNDEVNKAFLYLEEAYSDAKIYTNQNPKITKELVNMIAIPYAYVYALKYKKELDPELKICMNDMQKDLFPSPRVMYNLACYYSGDLTPNYDKALDYLERALEINPDYFTDAENDPSLDRLREGENLDKYEKRIKQVFGKKE
jgi:tetratricopeptide (TPR) repeat protein